MITDRDDFARAVQDAIIHAKSAIPEETTKAFNDATERIIAAAEEYAPIYVAEHAEPPCFGPCCGGTP